MIVVLSLNTAVDRILRVPHFEPGHVFRAAAPVVYAGGKGLNVARAVRRLEEPVRVIGLLGGVPAAFIRRQCSALGIEQHWVETENDSRNCVIVVDEAAGKQTVINEPGPQVQPETVNRLHATIDRHVAVGDLLSISGSAPPGVPGDFYAEMVDMVQRRGGRALADVAGGELRVTLRSRPWTATPNYQEAVAALGHGEPDELAARLARDAEHVLLTLGQEGALYAHGDRVWHLIPPAIHLVNAVGSGDAFVAGYLVGIQRGFVPLDAARMGVACGASNAQRLEPEIGPMEAVVRLGAGVTVHRLA